MTQSSRTRARRAIAAAALWCIATVLMSDPVGARQAPSDPSALCEAAAAEASRSQGVPLSVMTAISLNESGRRSRQAFRAWPWTVNLGGKGYWFATRDEAVAFATRAYEGGARSFDAGCFQINFRWHGQHFRSIDEMFDPAANARYAARFLGELFSERGSWEGAAGAYHSRTPEFAERYVARFTKFRAGLAGADGDAIPDIPDIVLAANDGLALTDVVARVNSYPLLQAGSGASLASLVPIDNGAGQGVWGSPPPGEVAQ